MLVATVIFNLTTGKRHRINRYRQGESDAEFWGRAVCAACTVEGEHYVSFDMFEGRGSPTRAQERVYVLYGLDVDVVPRVHWRSEYPFKSIKRDD